jgi:hypothetical protein
VRDNKNEKVCDKDQKRRREREFESESESKRIINIQNVKKIEKKREPFL